MHLLVPQGIGDSVWSMFKAQALMRKLGHTQLHIRVACWHDNEVESRAVPFLARFKFVDSVCLYEMPKDGRRGPVLQHGPAAGPDGCYRYLPDGPPDPPIPGIDQLLIANTPLEHGIRLEDWLPELETRWEIMDDFRFDEGDAEVAARMAEGGPYVVFYPGPKTGSTAIGHNRGGLWPPENWIELGDKLHKKYGVRIVVVGAEYDRSYFNDFLAYRVVDRPFWSNHIGAWPISSTLAVCKQARMVISFQSGIGIVSHYLGTPTAIWWRPKGDSIVPGMYVSFDEGMASAWANPKFLAEGKLLPGIYTRTGVDDVMAHAEKYGW